MVNEFAQIQNVVMNMLMQMSNLIVIEWNIESLKSHQSAQCILKQILDGNKRVHYAVSEGINVNQKMLYFTFKIAFISFEC